MFENLTKKLHAVFRDIAGSGRLTEKNITESLRRVRTSLLEADVNYKVVLDFVAGIKKKAVGMRLVSSVSPAQMLVKIVYEDLTGLLGGEKAGMDISADPSVIMAAGLHGSGKTTTCVKLAGYFIGMGKRPLLAALDTDRPAAVNQLDTLGKQIGAGVFASAGEKDPVEISKEAYRYARKEGYNILILDTAGRLHIENALINELADIKKCCSPQEILLIVDSTAGQDAVNIAREFNDKLDISGFILTKLDGDSRGGAAVSIRAVTGKPVKFIGTGERTGDLQEFYPERIASRILGMGDVLTLVEKIEKSAREEEKHRKEYRKKQKKQDLNLDDFLKSIKQIRKIAPLAEMMKMLPAGGVLGKMGAHPDKELKKIEAIISSMTREERVNPDILDGSRKKRISAGSGTTAHDVNTLLTRFSRMKKSMKKIQKNMMPGGLGGFKMPGGIPHRPFPPKW